MNGFCPSFITVEGGQLRKPKKAAVQGSGGASALERAAALPAPALPALEQPFGVLVTGIGGTGVITVGQILAMAAHVEHKSCSVLDMSGLAQKGGPVMSHVRLAASDDQIHSTRVGTGGADLVIGCDVIVAASKDAVARMGQGRTHAVINATLAPTAAFVRNPDWEYPDTSAADTIRKACGEDAVAAIEAGKIATALMGDAIATNMFMLGYAWQRGWVPLTEASLMKAIELNGVSVSFNQQSFAWGRLAASDFESVQREIKAASPAQVIEFKRSPSLEDIISKRTTFLIGYQNAAYAKQYQSLIEQVRAAESKLVGQGALKLTEAVAKYYFKLMAYKDEYEVARLHSDPAFRQRIASMFEGDYKIKYHLAPPMLSSKDAHGHLIKREFGSWVGWVFPLLSAFRFLRGSFLDPFGHTEERKTERALITQYRDLISGLLPKLSSENLPTAIALASIPEDIRGYGHVKERHLRNAKQKETELLARLDPVVRSDGDTGRHAA